MKKSTIFLWILLIIFAVFSLSESISNRKLKNKLDDYQNRIKDSKQKIDKLEEENIKLKARLQEKTASQTVATTEEKPQQAPPPPPPDDRRRNERWQDRDPAQIAENMRNRFEELKNSDPERYNEIMQRVNEFTQRIDNEVKDRIDYLKNLKIDESYMTPEEIEAYNKLISTLEKNSKTLEYLVKNPGADDATTLRMELFQSAMETRDFMEKTRAIAIKNIGIQNGLSGEKLKQFQEEINKAYEMTSFNVGRFGGRQNPGRGRR